MQALQPMSLHLATERLVMRPWSLADVGDYRALVAERGGPMPSDIDIRDRIATQLAATTRTGLALLPLRRLVEGDFLGYCGLLVGRAPRPCGCSTNWVSPTTTPRWTTAANWCG